MSTRGVSLQVLCQLGVFPLQVVCYWYVCTQGAREENTAVDQAKAQTEAQALYQAGEKKWGTDESKFNQIIVVRSFPQLRATFDHYVRVSNLKVSTAWARKFYNHTLINNAHIKLNR